MIPSKLSNTKYLILLVPVNTNNTTWHALLSEWYRYWASQQMKVLADTQYYPILVNIGQDTIP